MLLNNQFLVLSLDLGCDEVIRLIYILILPLRQCTTVKVSIQTF